MPGVAGVPFPRGTGSGSEAAQASRGIRQLGRTEKLAGPYRLSAFWPEGAGRRTPGLFITGLGTGLPAS